MKAQERVCERDGVATRLRCAECEAGICPTCLVRTAVGYKCQRCAGEGARTTPRRGRARLAIAGGAALIAVVVALRVVGGSGPTRTDPVGVQAGSVDAPATREAMLGEEARDGQLVFVVDDIACSVPDAPPDAGAQAAKRCALRFRVRNDSNSPALLLSRFQYLVDAEARTYGSDTALTSAVPENANRSLSELNINPEVVVPLVFVFELPPNIEPTEAQFKGTGRSRFGVNVRLQRRA